MFRGGEGNKSSNTVNFLRDLKGKGKTREEIYGRTRGWISRPTRKSLTTRQTTGIHASLEADTHHPTVPMMQHDIPPLTTLANN